MEKSWESLLPLSAPPGSRSQPAVLFTHTCVASTASNSENKDRTAGGVYLSSWRVPPWTTWLTGSSAVKIHLDHRVPECWVHHHRLFCCVPQWSSLWSCLVCLTNSPPSFWETQGSKTHVSGPVQLLMSCEYQFVGENPPESQWRHLSTIFISSDGPFHQLICIILLYRFKTT